MDESNKAITHMGEVALKNLKRSCRLVEKYDEGRVNVIGENEDNLDMFTDSMDSYLVNLAGYVETEHDNQHINILMQASTNFERVGDHAINIMEVAQKIYSEKLELTDTALRELNIVEQAVMEITEITVEDQPQIEPEPEIALVGCPKFVGDDQWICGAAGCGEEARCVAIFLCQRPFHEASLFP